MLIVNEGIFLTHTEFNALGALASVPLAVSAAHETLPPSAQAYLDTVRDRIPAPTPAERLALLKRMFTLVDELTDAYSRAGFHISRAELKETSP